MLTKIAKSHDRTRTSVLVVIMAVLMLICTGIAVTLLYRAALDSQRQWLVQLVESQARYIAATYHARDGDRGATLRIVKEAHADYEYKGFGQTGEYLLLRRDGSDIFSMLEYRDGESTDMTRIPHDTPAAELLRRSLSGPAGDYLGTDQRGVRVLAAYEAIPDLEWGIVAKIDLAEIRAPFVRAGVISALIAGLGIWLGATVFTRVNAPLIRKIEHAREFSESLVQNLILPAFVLDPGHRVLIWNKACEELTGVPAAAVVGTRDHWRGFYKAARPCLADIVIDGRGQAAAATYRSTSSSELVPGGLRAENWCDLPKGMRRCLLIDAGPIYDEKGRLVAVVETLQDVTDARGMERELVEARDAALAGSRAKSQFLANMSHEIRTPMNGVLGMLDLLKDTPLNAHQRDFVLTAHRSAEGLLEIINDILDISKIEAGRLELETVDMDVRQIVEDVGTMLSQRANDKGIELTCLVPVDIPTRVKGDSTRLRQILVNLLGNAIKFTERGDVAVRVSLLEAGEVRVKLHFAVTDSGIGIAEEARRRLFRTFSQADGSTTRKYGGTGLGLAISKELVEMMGGEIGVDSVLGRGSTFWFTTDLARQTAVEAQPSAPRCLHGIKVLSVDDNATNRVILEHYLTSWGMHCESVDGGVPALAVLRAAVERGEPFDMAILDMQMPGMDGVRLSARIEQDEALRGLPRLLLSSMDHLTPEQIRAAGLRAMLQKPVRQSCLFDRLVEMTTPAAMAPATIAAPGDTAGSGEADATALPRGARILLVEDNRINQAVACGILDRLGVETVIANNGREAAGLSGTQHFDLVFMDCQMPEMDGFEATAAIRAREGGSGGPRLTIVAMTANAMEGDRQRCLEAGMDDYLSKPVRRESVAKMLQKWLRVADVQPDRPAIVEPAVTGNSRAAIEFDVIEDLRKLLEDRVNILVETYLEEAERLLDQIRAAAAADDPRALREAAHSLKSSSANVGAVPLSEFAGKIELRGRNGAARDAAEWVLAAEREYLRVQSALREYLSVRPRAVA